MIPKTPNCNKVGKTLKITTEANNVVIRLVNKTTAGTTEISTVKKTVIPGAEVTIDNMYKTLSPSKPLDMSLEYQIQVYGFDDKDGASQFPWESEKLTPAELKKFKVSSPSPAPAPIPTPTPTPTPAPAPATKLMPEAMREGMKKWLRLHDQAINDTASAKSLKGWDIRLQNAEERVAEIATSYPDDPDVKRFETIIEELNKRLEKIAEKRKTAKPSPAPAPVTTPASAPATPPAPEPETAPVVVPKPVVKPPISFKPIEEKSEAGVSAAEALMTLAEARRVLNEAKATRAAVEEMVTKAAAEKAAASAPTSTPKDKDKPATDDNKETKTPKKSTTGKSGGWVKWLIPPLVLIGIIFGALKFIDWEKKNRPEKVPSTSVNSLATGVIPIVATTTTSTNSQTEIGDAKVIATANPGGGSAFSANITGDGGKIIQVAGNYFGNDNGEGLGKKQGWPKGCVVDKDVNLDPPSDGSDCVYVVIPAGEYHRFHCDERLWIRHELFKVPATQISMEVDGVEVDSRKRDWNSPCGNFGYFNGGSEDLRIKFTFKGRY